MQESGIPLPQAMPRGFSSTSTCIAGTNSSQPMDASLPAQEKYDHTLTLN